MNRIARKAVKVYLPPQLGLALEVASKDLGISEEEIMRWAFTEFAISRGRLAQSHLDPAELSDRPIQRAKDQSIINALKAARDQA
ncbi:MAG: hypothetical protein ABSA11_05590 [Candidatus Bathyarchaeia archaeon]